MKITKKELDELLRFWLDLCERAIKENETTPTGIITFIHHYESMVDGLRYLFADYPDALLSINVASDHLHIMKLPKINDTHAHEVECLDEHCLGC